MFEASTARRRQFLELFDEAHRNEVRRDLTSFFGLRAEIYLKVYDKMCAGSAQNKIFPATWSWPVFFGSFVWFFYRKMYAVGAIFIVLPIAFAFVLGSAAGSGIMIAFAVIAKALYVQSALGRVQKANSLGLSGAERTDYFRRAGGVSVTAGVFAGLLFAAMLGMFAVSLYIREQPFD